MSARLALVRSDAGVTVDEPESVESLRARLRAKSLPLCVSHVQTVASNGAIASESPISVRPIQALSPQILVAADFDHVCRLRTEAGDMASSNRACADRLRIDERRIREWRAGARRIPSDVWLSIGSVVAVEFLRALLARVEGK